MLLKACPAHKVTVAHAEMTVALAVVPLALLVLVVASAHAAHKVVVVMAVVLRHLLQPKHKRLFFFN
jgi:hypothetical protein